MDWDGAERPGDPVVSVRYFAPAPSALRRFPDLGNAASTARATMPRPTRLRTEGPAAGAGQQRQPR